MRVRVEHDSISGFDRILCEGLGSLRLPEWSGAPELPAIRDRVVLPPGRRVAQLIVLTLDPALIASNVRPFPTRPPDDGDSLQVWGPDPFYYEEGNLFPPRPDFLLSNDGFHGVRLADLGVVPFAWTSDDGDLTLYQTIEVSLLLEPFPIGDAAPVRLRPERRFSRDGFELRWARDHARNPDDVDAYYRRDIQGPVGHDSTFALDTRSHATGFHPTDRPSLEGPAIDMVILTSDAWSTGEQFTGSMTAVFQDWADWRTTTGIPTVVRTLPWIRANYHGADDPERIRSFLKEAYSLWGTDYLLIGGDVEVIPSRRLKGKNVDQNTDDEHHTAWCYAGLDATWGSLDDGYFDNTGDTYPDLWVGRVPVRDSDEASAYLAKIRMYERVPGHDTNPPNAAYYSKAVLLAGPTNFGGWVGEDDLEFLESDTWYKNGIWLAEAVKTDLLDDVGFSSWRLYPDLDFPASCGGSTLTCYKPIVDYLNAEGAPEAVFNVSNARTAIETQTPSIFFHAEHSHRHVLGGLSDEPGRSQPARDVCWNTPACSDCDAWQNTCFEAYKANNEIIGALSREFVRSWHNGPNYFVGLTIGSKTGTYEGDAVAEEVVRDPDGGAVVICARAMSINTVGTTDTNDPAYRFFDNGLRGRLPVGAALGSAHLELETQIQSRPRISWHLLGDPSLVMWTSNPGALTVESNVETLGNPDFYDVVITIRRTLNNALVEDARVCLSRDDDVYAIGRTDASGQARFPSLLVSSSLEGIDVWATADNSLPQHFFIDPATYTNLDDLPALVYDSHEATDEANPGPEAGVFEAGDRVRLDVALKNIAAVEIAPGTARLVATPRVRMALRIDGLVATPGDVFIGKMGAHPPAEQDTFSLIANESGLRPEIEPTITPDNDFKIWRDPDTAHYHIRLGYGAVPPSNPGEAFVIADGGITIFSQDLEPEDSVEILPDGKSLRVVLDPDSDDDELVFTAKAPEWLTMVRDEISYGTVVPNDTVVCRFKLDLLPTLPARQRVTFTVVTQLDDGGDPDPLFSDFYIETAAPRLSFVLQEVNSTTRSPFCSCSLLQTEYRLVPYLYNTGNAVADSVEVTLTWSGASASVCPNGGVVALTVPPGEEVGPGTGFRFCDSATLKTLRVDRLLVKRRINGVWITLADEDPNPAWNPWPISLGSQVENLDVHATESGFRVRWEDPPSVEPIGYHVYVDDAGSVERLTDRVLTESAQTWTIDQPYADGNGTRINYKVGVSAVTTNYVEGDVVWSGTTHSTLQAREGWPKRMPQGPATAVVAVDLDSDGDLEVLAGGRVMAAWNEDGSPVLSGNPDGLLFNPVDDEEVGSNRFVTFWGELAAADIDGDQQTEIAGMFGDDKLYVADETGSPHAGFPKTVPAKSGPTLADLDQDGDYEILVNAYFANDLYAFNQNGSSFRTGNASGLYAHFGGDTPYNFAGVAVGDIDSNSPGLEIVHVTQTGTTSGTPGKIYVWKSQSSGSGNPAMLWGVNPCNGSSPCNGPFSTPVVADVNNDDQADVVLNSRGTDFYRTVVLDGASPPGDTERRLIGWRSASAFHQPEFTGAFTQSPAVGQLNALSNGNLEAVTGRLFTIESSSTPANSRMLKVSLLHTKNSTVSHAGFLAGFIQTLTDSLPLPGRKSEVQGNTIENPILADIDGDDKIELVISTNHCGLFAWELTPTLGDSFQVKQELGWPIIYSDIPCTPTVADLDGDNLLELIVGVEDGYVWVYDLPGMTTDPVEWPTAAYDPMRSGNVGNYSAARPTQPNATPTEPPVDLLVAPNPVATASTVRFRTTKRERVTLEVYDTTGRRVRRLVESTLESGIHEVSWAGIDEGGRRVASGVYYVRMSAGERVQVRRLLITR